MSTVLFLTDFESPDFQFLIKMKTHGIKYGSICIIHFHFLYKNLIMHVILNAYGHISQRTKLK